MLLRLRNTYPHQGQVLTLMHVAQFIPRRQAACLCPVDSSSQVALCQFHLRPHSGPVSQQLGGKATLVSQLHESIQRRECLDTLPTCLLEASQGQIAPHDHLGVCCQRAPDQIHALHQVLLGPVKLVPLTQQIAQDEEVVCTVEQGLQSPVP